MRPKTLEAMKKLFSAEWNLPKAAAYCDLTLKEMKITFSAYCSINPPTHFPRSDPGHATVDPEPSSAP